MAKRLTDKTRIDSSTVISTNITQLANRGTSDASNVHLEIHKEIRVPAPTPTDTLIPDDTDTCSNTLSATSKHSLFRPKTPLKSLISEKEYTDTHKRRSCEISNVLDVELMNIMELFLIVSKGGEIVIKPKPPYVPITVLTAYIWYMNLLRTNPFNYITDIPLTIEIKEI